MTILLKDQNTVGVGAYFGIIKVMMFIITLLFLISGIYRIYLTFDTCSTHNICLSFITPTISDFLLWKMSSKSQNRAYLWLEFLSQAIFQSTPLLIQLYLRTISKYQQQLQQQHQISKHSEKMNCLIAKYIPPHFTSDTLQKALQ